MGVICDGPWQTQFEVASFSRCRNIKEEPLNYEGFPQTRAKPIFFWVEFYDGAGQTQTAYQIWSLQLQPLRKYLRGTSKFGRAPIAKEGTRQLFFICVWFYNGTWKPQRGLRNYEPIRQNGPLLKEWVTLRLKNNNNSILVASVEQAYSHYTRVLFVDMVLENLCPSFQKRSRQNGPYVLSSFFFKIR